MSIVLKSVKKISCCVLCIILFNLVHAQNRVQAIVTGFRSNNGVCRACLFNNQRSFDGEADAFQCQTVSIVEKVAQLNFENIPQGTYAISVFHDANSNNKFDKNFLGIPKEGYGASKNNLPFASAPQFVNSQFSIATNTLTKLTIKIRNL